MSAAYPWNPAAPVPAEMAHLFKVDLSEHRRRLGRGNGNFTPIVLSGNLHHQHKPIARRKAAI